MSYGKMDLSFDHVSQMDQSKSFSTNLATLKVKNKNVLVLGLSSCLSSDSRQNELNQNQLVDNFDAPV